MGLKWRRSIWLNSQWLWPEGSVGTSTNPVLHTADFFRICKTASKNPGFSLDDPLKFGFETKHQNIQFAVNLMQTYTTTTYISL